MTTAACRDLASPISAACAQESDRWVGVGHSDNVVLKPGQRSPEERKLLRTQVHRDLEVLELLVAIGKSDADGVAAVKRHQAEVLAIRDRYCDGSPASAR